MASSFKLILDTLGPLGPTFLVENDFPVISSEEVNAEFTVEDASTTGFQFKIWSEDLDPAFNEHIQATEEESDWITYGSEAAKKVALLLLEGDGSKTIFARVRDDVWNESDVLESSFELNTAIPTITITAGPSAGKISEVTGKDQTTFTFKSTEELLGWKVLVVPSEGSAEDGGQIIAEASGSENTDQQATELAAETSQAVKIDGSDLAVASGGDGEFIIKVFGQSKASGLWSA